MSKYRVEIETPANTQGAEKAAKALQDVGKAATSAAASTGQFASASQGAAGSAGSLTGSLLGNLSVWKALAAVVAIGVAKFRQFQEEVDKMGIAIQKLDPANNTLKTFFEIIAKNKNSDDEFAKRLAAIGNAAETTEEKVRRMTDVMTKTLSLEAGEDQALKKVRLAQISQDEKTGKISKAQAAEARGRVEVEFERREAARETRRRAGEVQAAFNLRTGAEDARIAAERALPGAKGERVAAQQAFEEEQKRAKSLSAAGINVAFQNLTLEEAVARRDAIKDAIANPGMVGEILGSPHVSLLGAFLKPHLEKRRLEYLDELETGISGFERNRDIQAALVARAQGRLNAANQNVATLESSATQAESARVSADRRYRQSIADTNQDQTSDARRQRMEAVAGGIESETARMVEVMERIHAALKLVNAANLRELQR